MGAMNVDAWKSKSDWQLFVIITIYTEQILHGWGVLQQKLLHQRPEILIVWTSDAPPVPVKVLSSISQSVSQSVNKRATRPTAKTSGHGDWLWHIADTSNGKHQFESIPRPNWFESIWLANRTRVYSIRLLYNTGYILYYWRRATFAVSVSRSFSFCAVSQKKIPIHGG